MAHDRGITLKKSTVRNRDTRNRYEKLELETRIRFNVGAH